MSAEVLVQEAHEMLVQVQAELKVTEVLVKLSDNLLGKLSA